MSMNRSFEFDFFMSQIEHLRDIKENEKIKISLVLYEGIQGPCILKICKNRNLSDVCRRLIETRHPNVAVIYDYLYVNNNTYIVEEFLTGTTLREFIEKKGTFSEKETVNIIIDVCKGLEILHSQQPPVVHNDINTANIMVREDGSVKVFDFDISRTYKEGSGKNTRLFGTEEYAAPEHFGYGQSEPRTDIYSLGVTMHEMLTGNQLTNEHKMTYNGKLKKVIRKCIEVDPKKRYTSAKQLRKDLEKKKQRKFVVLKILMVLIGLTIVFGMIHYFIGNDLQGEKSEIKQDSIIKNTEKKQPISNEQDVISITEGIKVSEEEIESNIIEEKKSEESIENNDTTTTSEMVNLSEEKIVKKVKNVYSIQDELLTILALNDGTIVWLEEINKEYYIKTSTGVEKKLEGYYGGCGADLGYNDYTDTLYLFEDKKSYTNIYLINKDYELSFVTKFDSWSVDIWDMTIANCNFYSDGTMISMMFDDELIDSNSWTPIGNGPWAHAVIGDKMYYMKYNYDNDQYISIEEIDFQDNVINTYELPEILEGNYSYYSNKNYFYIIGSKEEKTYVYRFDGHEWKNIVCLNEYMYFSEISQKDFCVTDNVIWIYDRMTKTIKEFELN